MSTDLDYAAREALTETLRQEADAGYRALTTPEGMRACFPVDRHEHGWKYPAGRKVSRQLINMGRAPSRQSFVEMRKHKRRSLAGVRLALIRSGRRSA